MVAAASGIEIEGNKPLDEIRNKVTLNLNLGADVVCSLEENEDKVVRANRLVATWLIFWTSVFPATITSIFVLWFFQPLALVDAMLTIRMVFWFAGIFVVSSIGGLIVQSLFTKPLLHFLNWLCG